MLQNRLEIVEGRLGRLEIADVRLAGEGEKNTSDRPGTTQPSATLPVLLDAMQKIRSKVEQIIGPPDETGSVELLVGRVGQLVDALVISNAQTRRAEELLRESLALQGKQTSGFKALDASLNQLPAFVNDDPAYAKSVEWIQKRVDMLVAHVKSGRALPLYEVDMPTGNIPGRS